MEREHLKPYYEHQLKMVLQRIDPIEYGYDARHRVKNRPEARPMNLTENNRKLLKQYHRHMINENLALSRISLVLGVMGRLLEMLNKDFETATKEDILGSENASGLVSKINSMDISAVTKSDYLKKLKMLDKWLNGGEEASDRTRKIKTGLGKKHHKLPSQLITPEEAQIIIDATDNIRDRALFHLLWESGCRVGEAINLKINSIQFDKGEAKINLFGKVGERQILLLESVHDLKEYMKTRSLANQDDPLFLNTGKVKGQPLSHGAI
ncbi:MAG: tyrosine-type recombinase/integrase, partial [Candidatus Diapherotrites archaeon]|nr:tyrosine-type recombinase/integrase [Candidatus Diapherotrites archaeon]